MLPLWIIDITKKSDRRDAFLHLVGQIEHVYFTDKAKKEMQELAIKNSISHGGKNSVGDDVGAEHGADTCRLLNDKVVNEDEKRAARNARIKGNYWYYSSYDLESDFKHEGLDILEHDYLEKLEVGVDLAYYKDKSKNFKGTDTKDQEAELVEELNSKYKDTFGYQESLSDWLKVLAEYTGIAHTTEEIGLRFYGFQEAMVKDAKNFITELRKSNAKPSQPINIVVLGDATEPFTQLVFSSIAAILQKEKGRFLAGHIHQGMSIVGMLYVPCDANAREVSSRERILRLFHEIEVQYNIAVIRGYDNVMLYQDVQNRAECTYTKLDNKGLAEYLVQCLVHLYLACDINHPLLSGRGTDDVFYFSMGATSIYFDVSAEDKRDANDVAFKMVDVFKEDGDHLKDEVNVDLLDKDLYSSNKFVEQLEANEVDLDGDDMRKPRVHPIKDWHHRNLKQFYYQDYLRFYPAELLRSIMQRIEEDTNDSLDKISKIGSSAFKNAEIALPSAIERVISRVNRNDGALAFIESKFKDMQEYFSKQKSNVQASIQSRYWNDIVEKMGDSSFDDYHDAYTSDIRAKNSGANCNSMKQELLKKLKTLLGGEKTFAATLARCVLLGIMCVMALLPVLKALSPDVINLGNVEKHYIFWSLLLFVIPFAIQYVLYRIYLRKRRNLIHQLKIYFIHDAYARIANRIESETVSFYDKMIELMEEYLNRCKDIHNEVKVKTPDPTIKLLFPKSKFNQPLNGGEFDEEPLIPESEIERRQIRINGRKELVNNISREQYYILINRFKDGFATLFEGVSLTEGLSRRFDETIGDYVFVSRDEILEQKKKEWEKKKSEFNDKLHAYIKENMCDRLYPTIGDKLHQYRKKFNCCDTLEYMVAMAATNGEFASQADTEYADVKTNCDINDFVNPYLSITSLNIQKSEYDELFKRYLFVTRWRTYKNISFNRLLPKEDFDSEVRALVNFEAEQAEQAKKAEMEAAKKNAEEPKKTKEKKEKVVPYKRTLSSLMLWAVCPNDNSSEWLQLFDMDNFQKAWKERQVIREIMNTDD